MSSYSCSFFSYPSQASEVREAWVVQRILVALLLDSEMAGPIGLKLGGMVKGIAENVLTKEFLGSVEVDMGQVSGPQVPLLGHGDDKETPNRA